MTIRTRLTWWYAAAMLVSLLLMSALLHREFSFEPQRDSLDEIQDEQNDLRETLRIVLWCGIPSSLLALGGGWWLTRRALAPVTALTLAVEQINERNLGERLPVIGNNDELDRLTEVFNAMTARLNNSFERIREFTLHASHELKTPLTVLCGETETELRDGLLTDAQRERAASQLDEFRRLSRIVDGLSLLAKADAGLIAFSPEPIPLHELVRDVAADAQILALANEIKVELSSCDEAVVSGDPHRLRQLLLNLADNAVKFNEPRGSVCLSLRRVGNDAEFQIANTGAGIDADALPRVFDRFYRGDTAHSRADGCGLGLSIAQWIVSSHNGVVAITSVPAKLTTVTVKLPLMKTE